MRKLLHVKISQNKLKTVDVQSDKRIPVYVLLDNIRSL